MEFGFDDSLFEESIQEVPSHPFTSYNAKVCELLWFQPTSGSDKETALQLLKYNGDYNYRQKQYELAAKNYGDALELVPKHNVAMRNDMNESLARCYVRLGQTDEAMRMAEEIIHSCTNRDQELQALSLLQHVHHTASQWREEYVTLVQLVMLQPLIARFWNQLAQCVRNIMDATTSGKYDPDLQASGDCINNDKRLENYPCNVDDGRTDEHLFDNNRKHLSGYIAEMNRTSSREPECLPSDRGSTCHDGSVRSKIDHASFQANEGKMSSMLNIDVNSRDIEEQACDLMSCQLQCLCKTKTFDSKSVVNSVPDMPKCRHKHHSDTGSCIIDRHSDSVDLLQQALTVCLCRARTLLKMSYYSTSSFTRDAYDNQLKQVDAAIQTLDITADELDRIIQLTSDTTDEGEQTNTKVDVRKDLVADFEGKWFMWSQAKPEDQS